MAMQASALALGQNGLSDSQIERFAKEFKEMLRTNREEFPRSVADDVFSRSVLLPLARDYITQETGLITRSVLVRRGTTALSAIAFPDWGMHIDDAALAAFRPADTTKTPVWFFRPREEMTHEELAAEYRFYGLRPADLFEIAAVLTEERTFADQHGCATVATDAAGKPYHCAFIYLEGKRHVFVAPVLGPHLTLLYAGVPL